MTSQSRKGETDEPKGRTFYFKSQEKVGHFFFFLLLGVWSRHANERGFLRVLHEKKEEAKFQSPGSARTGLKRKAW